MAYQITLNMSKLFIKFTIFFYVHVYKIIYVSSPLIEEVFWYNFHNYFSLFYNFFF